MDLSELVPKHGERAMVVGTTGSGKTVCVRNLAKPMMLGMETGEIVVIHDAKSTFQSPFPAQKIEGLSAFAKHIAKKSLSPIVRYVPDPEEMNNVKLQDPLWDWIYARGKNGLKTRLIIDEVFSTVTDTGRASASMRALWTRGREMGITAIACSQRPKTIPPWMIDQAERFFVYEVPLQDDRERIAEVTVPEMRTTPPGEYNCWYWYRKTRKNPPVLLRFPDLG